MDRASSNFCGWLHCSLLPWPQELLLAIKDMWFDSSHISFCNVKRDFSAIDFLRLFPKWVYYILVAPLPSPPPPSLQCEREQGPWFYGSPTTGDVVFLRFTKHPSWSLTLWSGNCGFSPAVLLQFLRMFSLISKDAAFVLTLGLFWAGLSQHINVRQSLEPNAAESFCLNKEQKDDEGGKKEIPRRKSLRGNVWSVHGFLRC